MSNAVKMKSNSRFFSWFMHGILVQIYWSIRVQCWLWKEKRQSARLRKFGVVPGASRLPSGGSAVHFSPSEEAALIAEVAEELRLQPLLFGVGKSLIKALSGNGCPRTKALGGNDVRDALAEQEAQLIAEYDAHFLASVRIKSRVAPLWNQQRGGKKGESDER